MYCAEDDGEVVIFFLISFNGSFGRVVGYVEKKVNIISSM